MICSAPTITAWGPIRLKVPPPLVLYKSCTLAKPFPLPIVAKETDMFEKKPCDVKRGISK
jgi:hypothetical protein